MKPPQSLCRHCLAPVIVERDLFGAWVYLNPDGTEHKCSKTGEQLRDAASITISWTKEKGAIYEVRCDGVRYTAEQLQYPTIQAAFKAAMRRVRREGVPT